MSEWREFQLQAVSKGEKILADAVLATTPSKPGAAKLFYEWETRVEDARAAADLISRMGILGVIEQERAKKAEGMLEAAVRKMSEEEFEDGRLVQLPEYLYTDLKVTEFYGRYECERGQQEHEHATDGEIDWMKTSLVCPEKDCGNESYTEICPCSNWLTVDLRRCDKCDTPYTYDWKKKIEESEKAAEKPDDAGA